MMSNMKPAGLLVLALFVAATVRAHSPICNCYDNGDGSITCEGGFSDGGSGAGVAIRVVSERERVLVAGEMDEQGTFSFTRPDQAFDVVFDAGESHVVRIPGEDIQ